MNALMTDFEARVWSYVHGEMDDEARRLFEREAALDGRLRGLVDEARRLDRRIRSSLSAFEPEEADRERLAGRILEEWECDRAGLAGIDGGARPFEFPLRANWRMLFRRPAYGLAGLAAAAVIIMTVAPFVRETDPREAVWDDPAVKKLTYRGPEAGPDGAGCVDASAALRGQKDLRGALERHCRERGTDLPAGLTFSVTVQELRGGAFSFVVQARWRGGQTAGEWVGDYSGWASFSDNLEASAARIAEALAVRAANRIRQEGSLYEHP